MKKSNLILVLAAILIGFASCEKRDEQVLSNVEASKTTDIKKGEPIHFSFSQVSEGSEVKWSVLPDNDLTIKDSGNTTSILFSQAGLYTVKASNGFDSGSVEVSVLDSIYNPEQDDPYIPEQDDPYIPEQDSTYIPLQDSTYIPGSGNPTLELLSNDQISITVSKMDSLEYSGLFFGFKTEKKYECQNHELLYDVTRDDGIKIIFNAVSIPAEGSCVVGEDYAYGGTAVFPIEDGNHRLEVVMDNVSYSGSFVKDGSSYTFTWPHASGIILAPLEIN